MLTNKKEIILVSEFQSDLHKASEILEEENPHSNESTPEVLTEEIELAFKHMNMLKQLDTTQ